MIALLSGKLIQYTLLQSRVLLLRLIEQRTRQYYFNKQENHLRSAFVVHAYDIRREERDDVVCMEQLQNIWEQLTRGAELHKYNALIASAEKQYS